MSKAGDSSHHLHGEGEVLVRAERAELQEARHGRKHAEQNLQLLSNRIALLRQEAKYAEKQIAEAKKFWVAMDIFKKCGKQNAEVNRLCWALQAPKKNVEK